MAGARKPWRAYGRYGSVGIELVLSIGLGYYLGKWADDHFHARGWLSTLGFFVGCYAGFKALWTLSKRMQKDVEREEAQDRGEDPWDDAPHKSDATPDAKPDEDSDDKPHDESDDGTKDDGKKD